MKLMNVTRNDKTVTLELDRLDLDIISTIKNHPVFGVDLTGTHKCLGGNICELINELAELMGD